MTSDLPGHLKGGKPGPAGDPKLNDGVEPRQLGELGASLPPSPSPCLSPSPKQAGWLLRAVSMVIAF